MERGGPLPAWTRILCLAIPIASCPLAAQNPAYLDELLDDLPEAWNPRPLFLEMDQASVSAYAGDYGSISWMDSNSSDFDRFVRIAVVTSPAQPWNAGLNTVTNQEPINAGDWILLRFFARAGSATEPAVFESYIQRSQPSWIGIGIGGGSPTTEWYPYITAAQADRDYPAGTVNVSIHVGQTTQTIDIAGLSVIHLNAEADPGAFPVSTLSYAGMEPEAAWRTTAASWIEQHRKGVLSMQVTDSAGQPLDGARVDIQQQSHAYPFASFFSSLMIEDTPEAEQYAAWFKDNFNAATNPVYWADWGWANPDRRQDYKDMAAWLQANDIPTRGHVLIYPGEQFAPRELLELRGDPEAFQARILEHLEEIVPIMRAYGVREYDVTNELRQLTEFTDIVGLEGVVAWFWKVRELDPDARLYINENSILSEAGLNVTAQDHYFQTITDLIAAGAPLDGIGMQGHFNEAVTPPERLWAILDRFSTFGLPIRVTEYDLSSRNLDGQARYDADFYTAIFAHPATAGLTRWGFYEPEMWRPLGAIIDADGAYKPNGLAQRERIFQHWHTEETHSTDSQGKVSLRAFYGAYQVTVTHEGRQYRIPLEFAPDQDGEPVPVHRLAIPPPSASGWLKIRAQPDAIHLTWPSFPSARDYTVQTSPDLVSWNDRETVETPASSGQLQASYAYPDAPLFIRVRVNEHP